VWSDRQMDLNDWVRAEADARAGALMRTSRPREILHEKVLVDSDPIGWHGSVFQASILRCAPILADG